MLWIESNFLVDIDILKIFGQLWHINVPRGLKELLWKYASGSLPIGSKWNGTSDLGSFCKCGSETTLPHIWEGWVAYDLSPLRRIIDDHTPSLCLGYYKTLDFGTWPSPYWYPLLCLKQVEKCYDASRKQMKAFKDSRSKREWAIGTYLWLVWKKRMKEVMDRSFTFEPWQHTAVLEKELGIG